MTQYTGYIPNPRETDLFLNLWAKLGNEPDGKKIAQQKFRDEKKNVILYPYLFQAFQNWNYGYQGIGDCVSWSTAHAIDVLMGVQIYLKNLPEQAMFQVCSETSYGFMRVEIFGRPNYSRDGSYGSAGAKSVIQCGTLHRTTYLNKYDFRQYSGKRAKQYGRVGVPDSLEPIAREHIVKDTTLIKDFETAARFIQNGYPITNAHSRNPVPRRRDKNGYGYGGSKIAHAMNYIGVRWEPKPALLKTNTGWGDHVSGGHWPDDMPNNMKVCSWWEEADICDKVFAGNDCFAYSDYKGFRAQNIPDYGFNTYL